jgi:ADP-heptose:LPS heptosyltransferase
MTPLIASAPADRERQEAIAGGSGCGMIPVSGSFAVFAAMLDRASVILTPDTSVVHLSAALGKATAMLVGTAATGAAWGPWGVEHRVLSGRGGLGSIDPIAAAAAVLSLGSATRIPFSSSTAS